MIEFTALLLVLTLFGGTMLYSFGFAPMVFDVLPAEDVRRFIRAAFPQYYLFVLATSLGRARWRSRSFLSLPMHNRC